LKTTSQILYRLCLINNDPIIGSLNFIIMERTGVIQKKDEKEKKEKEKISVYVFLYRATLSQQIILVLRKKFIFFYE
jgi:hypothetical protein